jgi:hypothetical protein
VVAASPLQKFERAHVLPARTRRSIEPRHRFDVVVQDVGPGLKHDAQRRLLALEVWNQDFDLALRAFGVDRPDRFRKVSRAKVRQVIAINRGHHHVRQRHGVHRVREFAGLVRVQGQRRAVIDVAVRAGPRTRIAHDHECGRAMMPALADIRAVRFFTDGVQAQVSHQAFDPNVVLGPRRPHLQPIGLLTT